ncbi:MAG: folylpolyglutamate synthase/dihydrofolate synthase family protein [Patescibacteria group bacterium]|jgi:dihydrofolate synthase/folylpolyglutamate synthase
MPPKNWPKSFARFDTAHKYLLSLDKNTDNKLQLTRIKAFLDFSGNPQNSFKTIHVAGTSGKGSTCVMLASILKAAGFKTGLALSPYLSNPLEKIQINNRLISEKEFLKLVNKYRDLILQYKLTYFEAFIALTFIYFKNKKVDYAVMETGLGGRLDATNVIDNPELSIVTFIGLDHEDQLGSTKEKIAKEKAAIIKDGKKAITGSRLIHQARFIDTTNYILQTSNFQFSIFNYSALKNIKLSLPGEYQIPNSILAIEAAKFLRINNKYIYQGLKEAKFFGRFSVIKKNPLIIADGAHNPDKMQAFVSSLKKAVNLKKYNRKYLLMAIKFDKDYKKMLKIINPYFDEAIITTFPLSLDPKLIKKQIKSKTAVIIKDPKKAYAHILKKIKKDDLLLITGSLYMIGDIFGV